MGNFFETIGDEPSGAFSPGIDNEGWTHTSLPTFSEQELAWREEEARRRRNSRIEWEMNHVDSTWGEKRRTIVPQPNARPPINEPPFVPPNPFPADKDINNYTVDDVNPIYGMDAHNIKLLDAISARTSRLSTAITYINDSEKRLDLNRVVQMVPFLAKRMREILTEACNEEMKENIKIITTINEFLYGTPQSLDTGSGSDDEPTTVEPIEPIDPNESTDAEIVDTGSGTDTVTSGTDTDTQTTETTEPHD